MIPCRITLLGRALLGSLVALIRSALGAVHLIPASRQCLFALEPWRGCQSVCSPCPTFLTALTFLGTAEVPSGFRVKVLLGVSPRAAPVPRLAGALSALPGLELSESLYWLLPFALRLRAVMPQHFAFAFIVLYALLGLWSRQWRLMS